MKKLILILCALAAASLSYADDGGSYKPEDWAYGNIYVEKPNEKIALERELLIVDQVEGDVEARFDFKNTTKEKVVVPCAFPVVITLPFFVHKNDGSVSTFVSFNARPRLKIWEILLQKKVENYHPGSSKKETYGGNITKDEVFALDKKLRTISCKEYLSELLRYGENDPTLNPCVIELDGKSVPVQTVGIETSLVKGYKSPFKFFDYEEDDYNHDDVYAVKLVLHFYHELSFKPYSSSMLTVRYKTETTKRAYRGTRYQFQYDISTGGTWKTGAINEFLVLTNSEMTAYNSKTQFVQSSIPCDGLYYAKNYMPQKNEYFEFYHSYGGDDSTSFYVEDCFGDEKKQPFVKNVRASSFLSGSYKIAGKMDHNHWEHLEFNLNENLRDSDYKPETSFDGNYFNGWVEGAKGDGIGEWIEFSLDSYTFGPFATNGLRRFAGHRYAQSERKGYGSYYDFEWNECGEEYSVLARAGGVGETWISNNRVKSMKLLDSNKKTKAILNFADLFPEFENHWTNDRISMNAVKNPVFLKKGTYRMQIESVYKGKKWDDTVLGEVWFIKIDDETGKLLENDKDGFFLTPLNKRLEAYVSKEMKYAENEMRSAEEYMRSIKDGNYGY